MSYFKSLDIFNDRQFLRYCRDSRSDRWSIFPGLVRKQIYLPCVFFFLIDQVYSTHFAWVVKMMTCFLYYFYSWNQHYRTIFFVETSLKNSYLVAAPRVPKLLLVVMQSIGKHGPEKINPPATDHQPYDVSLVVHFFFQLLLSLSQSKRSLSTKICY